MHGAAVVAVIPVILKTVETKGSNFFCHKLKEFHVCGRKLGAKLVALEY